ncbi:Ribosomal large subunit pseudouridine synthase E [Chromobacterium violaceum]|uniref:Ribosomal large subunit pseudouridine synthase E n=1 Tax=Chromobacterium violaceum TaxID=536 RepID=A0AAX2MB67_CHRVL|nr:Ribosomal large subunit pseudouridine synthase E [Chromobacterium violaceum]
MRIKRLFEGRRRGGAHDIDHEPARACYHSPTLCFPCRPHAPAHSAQQALRRDLPVFRTPDPSDAEVLRAAGRRVSGRTARYRQRRPAAADRRRRLAAPHRRSALEAAQDLLGAGGGRPERRTAGDVARGVDLGDFVTRPAQVRRIETPELWPRNPPVRFRKTVPDCWLEIIISEGKNRQVRRMTAKAGLPTLRLVRVAIGPWRLDGLQPGEMRAIDVRTEDLPRGRVPARRQARRPAPQSRSAAAAKSGKIPSFRFARNRKG